MMFRSKFDSPEFTNDTTRDLFAYRKKIKKEMNSNLRAGNVECAEMMTYSTQGYSNLSVNLFKRQMNVNSSTAVSLYDEILNTSLTANLDELLAKIENLDNKELVELNKTYEVRISNSYLNYQDKAKLSELQEHVSAFLLLNLKPRK